MLAWTRQGTRTQIKYNNHLSHRIEQFRITLRVSLTPIRVRPRNGNDYPPLLRLLYDSSFVNISESCMTVTWHTLIQHYKQYRRAPYRSTARCGEGCHTMEVLYIIDHSCHSLRHCCLFFGRQTMYLHCFDQSFYLCEVTLKWHYLSTCFGLLEACFRSFQMRKLLMNRYQEDKILTSNGIEIARLYIFLSWLETGIGYEAL